MGLLSSVVSAFTESKPTVPKLRQISPGEVQQATIRENLAALPGATQLAEGIFQQQLAQAQQAIRTLAPYLNIASQTVSGFLQGQLPSDLQRNITRMAAARSFGGGFAGTGLARAVETRDLGLTSLQLAEVGLGAVPGLTQSIMAVAPRPFDVSSMFYTPQQRLNFEVLQQELQFRRDWLKNQIDAMAEPWAYEIMQGLDNIEAAAVGLGTAYLGKGLGLGGTTTGTSGAGVSASKRPATPGF
jgi:hypothetical protein